MMGTKRPWIVAIGASGSEGLDDIKVFLQELEIGLPAVVMVVLHRPWNSISHLRGVLSRGSPMPIRIASDGERLTRGTVYIGEPTAHLALAAHSFGDVLPDPHRVHRNRTVDLLFNSVAKHAGPCAIGIVLSGALDDGSHGLMAIRARGGTTMVLTRKAGPPGMPENAADYDGPVDLSGDARSLAQAVGRLVRT